MENKYCPAGKILCVYSCFDGNYCSAKITQMDKIYVNSFDACPFPNLQKKLDRHPMCEDQPAQIDCRKDWCLFWRKGNCKNISPAITLNQDSTHKCWSYEEK